MPLPERFVRFAIRDLKNDIENLKGFNILGNELTRTAEYKEWLGALEAYYAEHYGDPTPHELKDRQDLMRRVLHEFVNNGSNMETP